MVSKSKKPVKKKGYSQSKRKNKKSTVGMSPGSLVYTGTHKTDEPEISLIKYNSSEVLFQQLQPSNLIKELKKTHEGVRWLNINGLHDVGLIENIGNYFQLHKLTLEDILNIYQRPKTDDSGSYLFVVVKMYMPAESVLNTESEQVSFVLVDNTLITFQEKPGDVFDHIRSRLNNQAGNLRNKGADYLLYALMDIVIDYYFPLLEATGEQLERLETDLLDETSQVELTQLHGLRRRLLEIRRSVYPLREVVNRLEKAENSFIKPDTRIYIRDLYDHTIQVIENVEVFRDMASGALDLYMNAISNKMNGIMKVLTIIGTIFLPLTFIAGVYGMNFEYMPELEWKPGYFTVLTLMLLIVVGMLFYFRKRKWI